MLRVVLNGAIVFGFAAGFAVSAFAALELHEDFLDVAPHALALRLVKVSHFREVLGALGGLGEPAGTGLFEAARFCDGSRTSGKTRPG